MPSHMMIVGHRGLVLFEGQATTCYGSGEMGYFNQVCPKMRRAWVATTKVSTVSWAEIAVSGTRSPWSVGRTKEEEADHQNIRTGYGDEHQAEDGEAVQEDNTHSTDVASEQSEETEE